MSGSSFVKPSGIINRVFSDVNGWSEKAKFSIEETVPASKAELELALTVLLVDLADSDQNFETSEYQTIVEGLHQMFGTSALQAKTLVSQATQVLKDLRGTSRYGSLLKDNLNEGQRMAILEIVDQVIAADNVEDGFEMYFKYKISNVLGIALPESKVAKTDTDS